MERSVWLGHVNEEDGRDEVVRKRGLGPIRSRKSCYGEYISFLP